MSKGQKILLIIAAALIVMAGIVYWLLTDVKRPTRTLQPMDQQVVAPVVPVEQPVTFTAPPLSTGERERATIQNTVMAFTERFGTYSNQNGGFDAATLQSMVTPSFYQWLSSTYVAQLTRDFPTSAAYSGMTTDAVAVSFKEVTDTAATVIVETMQTVQKNGDPITSKKNLQVVLVKTDAGWKIDGAYWLKP